MRAAAAVLLATAAAYFDDERKNIADSDRAFRPFLSERTRGSFRGPSLPLDLGSAVRKAVCLNAQVSPTD